MYASGVSTWSMTAGLLRDQLAVHHRSGARFIGVVLRDGSTMLVEQNRLHVGDDEGLAVTYMLPFERREIQIPVGEIAGTHPFSAPAVAEPDADGGQMDFKEFSSTLIEVIADEALVQAKARGFATRSSPIARATAPPDDLTLPEEIVFKATEVLYCDWDHFSRLGGLTGFSASTPVGGFGPSWLPNLRNKAKRKIKKKPKPLN